MENFEAGAEGMIFGDVDLLMIDVDSMLGKKRIDMKIVRRQFDRATIILLTDLETRKQITSALRSGADSCIPLNIGQSGFETAVRLALSGEGQTAPASIPIARSGVGSATFGRSKPPDDGMVNQLTKRERAVLILLLEGKSNNEIADRLDIRPGTVKVHVRSLRKKLGATNRTHAVFLARKLAQLPQLGGREDTKPLIFHDRTPKGRHYTARDGRPGRVQSSGDPRCELLRQGHAELVQQNFVLLVRTGVARLR